MTSIGEQLALVTTMLLGQMMLGGTSSRLTTSKIEFTVEGEVSRTGVTQVLEMFIPGSNTFQQVDSRAATVNADSSVTISLTSNPSQYIAASGQIQARISYVKTGTTKTTASIDYVHWKVYP